VVPPSGQLKVSGAIVGRVDHDGVFGDPELVELGEELAYHAVVLDHPVGIDAEAGHVLRLGLQPGPDVHPAWIEPGEERLARGVRPVDEVERRRQELLVDSLHALLVEGASVLAVLRAPGPEPRVLAGRVGVRRGAAHHPARTEAQAELGALGIIGMLGLILGVEVIEVAEELVEPVGGRQELISVAEMVLAELTGRIAERLQGLCDRNVFRL
jgi:hypothetical protein